MFIDEKAEKDDYTTALKRVLKEDEENVKIEELMKRVQELEEEISILEKNKAFLENEVKIIDLKSKMLANEMPKFNKPVQTNLELNKVEQFQRNVENEAIQLFDGYFQTMV